MRIGVCDDNKVLSEKYRSMLERCIPNKDMEFEIITYASGEELIEALEKDRDYLDILFLDILMDQLNGVETAKRIRKMGCKTILIFLTSSEEYIFETADVKAIAYLMKDELSELGMVSVLAQAINKAVQRKMDILEFQKDDGNYKISYEDICFIKTYQGFAYIHHWDGIIIENHDQDIQTKLQGKGFYQVHPQYIVGLRYILKIEKKQIILNDTSHNIIPLDKTYAGGLKFAFADFMMKEM